MPELPEVETVVRMIRARIQGRRIGACRFLIPRQLIPQTPEQLRRALRGRVIQRVGRRGKYIIIELDKGALVIHLRMSGRLYVRKLEAHSSKHERALIALDNGELLVLDDPRTLGTIRYYPSVDRIVPVMKLGWEPLERAIEPEELRSALSTRKMAIKPVLLDQRLWAGIGNIYASEALWLAAIDPRIPAHKLTRAQCQRLVEAVPAVLRDSLQLGGSSMRDFMHPDGKKGSYQDRFLVYGRDEKNCARCTGIIKRLVQAQRSTFFCPKCQKRR